MKQKIFDNVSLNIKSKYLVETYELLIGNNVATFSQSATFYSLIVLNYILPLNGTIATPFAN